MILIPVPVCPACGETDAAVGDAERETWVCTACGSSGTYQMTYEVENDHSPDRTPQGMGGDAGQAQSMTPVKGSDRAG